MLVLLKDLVCLLPIWIFVLFADGSIFKGFIFYPNCITNKTES